MIKPTVGRVVWYWPNEYEKSGGVRAVHASKTQPLAATICFVHGNEMVNLSVVDANGFQFGRTSVKLFQENEPTPDGGGFCQWMPYQKGQAAKTEELESALLSK